MSQSAQDAYTVKPSETSSAMPDDRNDPPAVEATSLIDAMAKTVNEPIKREVGDTVAFSKGRDYDVVKARVIPSTFSKAEDHELALYLNQGKSGGISVSLNTLKDIIEWASKEK